MKNYNCLIFKFISFLLILISPLYFVFSPVYAADIVIIKSNNITPYNQTIKGFKQGIKADINEYDLKGKSSRVVNIVKKIKKDPPKLIFAIGALAAVSIKNKIQDIPIIYTLVFSPESKGLLNNKSVGIYMEVDIKEQLSMFKRLLPANKKIGVLYSRLTASLIYKAQKDCKLMGIELIGIKVDKPEDVPGGVRSLIATVDAMLLVPDSIVVNKDSLYYIMLLTLENKIPFMVYNKNLVKAGALLSPVISYNNLGKQAAKLGRQILNGKKISGKLFPPESVEWALNLNIAKRLGLQTPAELLTLFKYVYK